jgi:gas vesicle protein GvpA/GvpJ/GvpM family
MSENLPALAADDDLVGEPDVTLVDLLDRLLAGGVVIAGDITLSLADIDLVHLSLRLVVSSVPTLQPGGGADR